MLRACKNHGTYVIVIHDNVFGCPVCKEIDELKECIKGHIDGYDEIEKENADLRDDLTEARHELAKERGELGEN